MDSLVLNIVWIIATAFSRVCGISESVLAKTKINAIITILDHCNQHRSFIGLTTHFNKFKKTENSKIISFASLQTLIHKTSNLSKSPTYTNSLEIELINLFNSVCQSKPPFLPFSNELCKRELYYLTNKTPDPKWISFKI